MVVTFFSWFLDEISAYAQLALLIFGAMKIRAIFSDISSDSDLENVTNIWKRCNKAIIGVCGESPVELKLRLHTTYHLIFGMVKDAGNTYYCTKNHVRGLCVGGDMVILFLVQ